MASIADLHTDILFHHVFCRLNTFDVWKLRLVSRKMHDLVWDYFTNACTSLFFSAKSRVNNNYVTFGAGVNILKACSCVYLRNLKITGVCNQTNERTVIGIFSLLANKDKLLLTTLSLKDLDLTGIGLCFNDFSNKCKKLTELKLSRIVVSKTVQIFLQTLLQHCTNTLKRLKLKALTFAANFPLPTQSLAALQHFSVTKCHNISSECILEEVFRKCHQLEVVDLRQVTSVSNRTLLVLLEYCSRVHHVYVRGCPRVVLHSLRHPKTSEVTFDTLELQETSSIVPRKFNIIGQI